MSAYAGFVAIVVSTLLALGTASLLAPRLGLEAPSGRHAPIDGLRGFAALFVFFCHAALWLYFAKTGRWANAPVRLYGNIGLGGVMVFFMITAYLFLSKLLQARHGDMDWLRLYVSRVLRLTPLYLVAVAVVVCIVAAASGFQIKEAPGVLLRELSHWFAFNIWATPDINGLHDTWMIIAGVTWSLRYEWCFYLLLPVMALGLKVRTSWAVVGGAGALAACFAWSDLQAQLAAPFLGGAAAAWLVRRPRFERLALHRYAAPVALAAFFVAVGLFRNPLKPVPLLLMAVAFVIVAGGNGLYGILTSRAARLLGEISYSMYLLHGIVLFTLAYSVVGVNALAGMSPWLYWAIIPVLTPLLVALCMLTFTTIERPAMQRVQRVTDALRRSTAVPEASP